MSERHIWTPEDDDRLRNAVTALAVADLRDTKIWHAVCGRLAPELCVSPKSAASRYQRLTEIRREAEAQYLAEVTKIEPPLELAPDPWLKIADRVEELERDQMDRIETMLDEILVRIQRIEEVWK